MGAQENKKAVSDAYEAFGKGDVPAVIAMNAPDAVWVNHTDGSPLKGEYKGMDGIGSFFGLVGEHLDISVFEMAPIAAEGDTVVALGRQTYVAKKTGKTVSGPVVHIFIFGADGKVTRFEEYETGTEGAFV
jgi:ketosteroid isomerase-like protein